jgi:hypothetical protein
MIDARSSALARHSLWRSGVPAAINGVSLMISELCPARTPDTVRETRALPIHLPHAQKSAPFCKDGLKKNFNNCFENVLNSELRELPFNPAFLVHFPHHAISHLTKCGSMLCAVSAVGSPLNLTQKSTHVSHCPSMSIKVIKGNLRAKNSDFFSGHFGGKTLINQRKTAKKNFKIAQKTRDF